MKKNVFVIIGVIVVVVALIFIVKKTKSNVPQQESIKIGAVLSLTGAASQDGEAIKNGIELAKKDLAKKGITVDINYQDDNTDSKKTVSGIQFLATQGVSAIIGPTWSFLGDAGAPVLDQRQIVGYEPANTSEYSSKGEYVFFGTTKVIESKDVIKKFISEHNAKTIVYIANQGGWGEINGQALEEAVRETDAKIIAKEMIPWGSEAAVVGTLLTKVRAENPDLIVASFDSDEGIINLLQKVSQYEMKATILAATTSFDRVIKTQEVVKGISTPVFTLTPELSQEFIKKYSAEYGANPGAYADTAYDGMMLLVNGLLEKSEDQSLKDYLKSTSYKGIVKTYAFDGNNDVVGGKWIIEKTN